MSKIRSFHPFPARMAPETISEWVREIPDNSVILDPMCGSGVVLQEAVKAGHDAIGYDIDPLAVLMSRVATLHCAPSCLSDSYRRVISGVRANRQIELSWIDGCDETLKFIDYWFAAEQREVLRTLAHLIDEERREGFIVEADVLRLCLSRCIITKHAGASLAWDIPHSRPHKVREVNDYDTLLGFGKNYDFVCQLLNDASVRGRTHISMGDCRQLPCEDNSVDEIISSPPYLNAIDYLRGHKFSLVWMGYTIPQLRDLRATSIGAERAAASGVGLEEVWGRAKDAAPEIVKLPDRQYKIVKRYAVDLYRFFSEVGRVLKRGGKATIVIGDSSVRGVYVRNSELLNSVAETLGLSRLHRSEREIPTNKRYLPIVSKNKSLENRMRTEIVQSFMRA